MKIHGFKTIAALFVALFGFSASDVMGQSSYQYLISDQDEVTPTPDANAKANASASAGAQGTAAQGNSGAAVQGSVTQDTAANVVVQDIDSGDDSNVLKLGGWLQAGYHSYNTGMFNNRDSEFNLHQAYFFAEKEAVSDEGLGLGFRMDYVYGIDGPDTQAFFGPAGHWDEAWDHGATFGHAIPQLYAEMAWGDAKFKVGKFYTIMGYEVVTAPDNFFYSHAFTMFNSEPFTHTGVLGEFDMGDVTVFGGWTFGWDSGFDSSIDDGNAYLGGASLSFGDAGSITNTSMYGRLGAGSTSTGFANSLVLDLNVTDNLNMVLQSDYVYNNGVNESYGVNGYLLYALNEQLSIGTRMEWWNNNTTGAPLGTSDLYAITHGLNIKVADNFILRPEARWNKDDDGFLIHPNHNNRYGFGMDAILTY